MDERLSDAFKIELRQLQDEEHASDRWAVVGLLLTGVGAALTLAAVLAL